MWSACGIWHGASWKYLVYGLYYFALVFLGMLLEPVFARLASALGQDRRAPLWRGVAVARTCLLVVVGMTLFRADTLADFGQMVASVFAGAGLGPLASGELFAHGCDLLDLRVALAGAAVMLAFDVLQRRPGGVSGLVLDHGTPLRWAAGVGLLCGDAYLGAEAKLSAVGERCGQVHIHAGCIHFLLEAGLRLGIFSHYAFAVARRVACYVVESLIDAANGLERHFVVHILMPPVVGSGVLQIGILPCERCERILVGIDSDVLLGKRSHEQRQVGKSAAVND